MTKPMTEKVGAEALGGEPMKRLDSLRCYGPEWSIRALDMASEWIASGHVEEGIALQTAALFNGKIAGDVIFKLEKLIKGK